jgi:hypothetical protein
MLASALLAFVLAAPPAAGLPEGNEYVRALVARRKARQELLSRYTYDVEQLVEELDPAGEVLGRRVRRFEVFHVKGREVFKLVARDGEPLARTRQEDEERRVQEEVEGLTRDKSVLEDTGARVTAILERYDFRTVGREDLDGFPALVLDFQPRPGKRDLEGDVFLRAVAGRIWVDEGESELVRAEMRNTAPIKLALGVGASVSTLNLVVDFRRVEPGLWMPLRVETLVEGRLLLLKAVRARSTAVYSRYRRFETDSDEKIAPPQ